jgi:hypothetical protein
LTFHHLKLDLNALVLLGFIILSYLALVVVLQVMALPDDLLHTVAKLLALPLYHHFVHHVFKLKYNSSMTQST